MFSFSGTEEWERDDLAGPAREEEKVEERESGFPLQNSN